MEISEVISKVPVVGKLGGALWKFKVESEAKARSLRTYPWTLKTRYGKLPNQESKNLNSIDILDIFVPQNAIEYLYIGQLEKIDFEEDDDITINNKDDDDNEDNDNTTNNKDDDADPDSLKSESVLDVFEEEVNRLLVILGDPGSGKSTLVRYLALDWAKWWTEEEMGRWLGLKSTIESYCEFIQGKKLKQFPILIELGDYTKNRKEGESFREFWYRGIVADRKLNKENPTELNNQNIVVIFDGLNEIEDRQVYLDTVRQIIYFASQNHHTRIIVTSRIIDYDDKSFESFENANFLHFKLEHFDDSQREKFINKWCNLETKENRFNRKRESKKKSSIKKYSPQETAEDKEKRLSGEIDKFTSMAGNPDIAGNPELLMMMVRILEDRGSLTEQELYDRLSRMRLASSNENRIDRREKQVILGLIAYEMQFGVHELGGNSLDNKSLKELLIDYFDSQRYNDPRELAVWTIEKLKSGRFITTVDSGDTYSFVNPKILGYFCAREVKRRFKILLLPIKTLFLPKIFGDHYQNENKHESLRLICATLDVKDALELVSLLMAVSVDRVKHLNEKNLATEATIQHLYLARECLTEIKDYYRINLKIDSELKEKLQTELCKPGVSLNQKAAKIITDSIAKHYEDTLEWLRDTAFKNGDRFVRQAVVESIGEYFNNKSGVYKWLLEIAEKYNQDEFVQRVAIRAIAKYYHMKKAQPPTSGSSPIYCVLEWLKERFNVDQQYLLQIEFVQAIAKYYHKESGTFELIEKCAMNHKNPWVRSSAVKTLAYYYNKKLNTFGWLEKLADDKAQPESVRIAAVESIVLCYGHTPERSKWLKDLKPSLKPVQKNQQTVQSIVIRSIAKYYRDEPDTDTFRWLQQLAEDPQQANSVRIAAVKSIALYYWHKSDTFGWLKKLADEESQRESVRIAAVESIVLYYSHTPERSKWLKGLIKPSKPVQKNQQTVPSIVVRSIAKYYCDEPDTFGWLQECAKESHATSVRIAAVESIAKYYCDEPDTLGWLQKCAEQAQAESVRIAAVESIVLYSQTPEILKWLKELKVSEQVLKKEASTQSTSVDDEAPETTQVTKSVQSVQSIVVRSIAKYYRHEPDTFGWLKERAEDPQQPQSVRIAAVESISLYYWHEPDTLRWLQQRAEEAQPELVRIAAVKSIVQYYSQTPEILKWLKDLIKPSKPVKNMGSIVVRSIAKYYRHEPDTFGWLKERAEDPQQPQSVRIAAVESIELYYCQTPEIAVKSIELYYCQTPEISEWLKGIKLPQTNQPNPEQLRYVRASGQDNENQCGIKSIDYYQKEPNSLIRLQKIALEDKKADVRVAAVKSIIKDYREESDTLKCLQEIAMEVDDLNVRLAAVESIAKYYGQKYFIFAWLKECALNDHEPLVRSASIRAINEYFPRNNEISNILQLVIDRDLDRDIDDEDYPKAVAVQILKDRYK
jgi:hypothetical protein